MPLRCRRDETARDGSSTDLSVHDLRRLRTPPSDRRSVEAERGKDALPGGDEAIVSTRKPAKDAAKKRRYGMPVEAALTVAKVVSGLGTTQSKKSAITVVLKRTLTVSSEASAPTPDLGPS